MPTAEPAPGARFGRRGPHLLFERGLWRLRSGWVAGADEVGRGPLAGPVVAAAVVLPPGVSPSDLAGVDDSKRVSPPVRTALAAVIRRVASAWAVAEVAAEDVDRWRIAAASHHAVRLALVALPLPLGHALVDGLRNPLLPVPHTPIVGGDGLCLSIAAASVLAKVHRDGLMQGWDQVYPGYGFAAHKGYPTRAHRAAIARLGPCPLHRRTFRWE